MADFRLMYESASMELGSSSLQERPIPYLPIERRLYELEYRYDNQTPNVVIEKATRTAPYMACLERSV